MTLNYKIPITVIVGQNEILRKLNLMIDTLWWSDKLIPNKISL